MEGQVATAVASWMPGPGAWLLVWLLKGSLLLALLFPFAALLRRSSSSARHLVWTVGLAMVAAVPLASAGVLPWRLELPVVAAFSRAAQWAGFGGAWNPFPVSGSQSSGSRSTRATAAVEPNGARGSDAGGAASTLPAPPVAAGVEAAGASAGSTPGVSAVTERGSRAAAGWSVVDVVWFAVLAWAVGAVLVVLWLGQSAVRARRLVRDGTPLTDRAWTTPLIEAADRLDLGELPRLLVNADAAVPLTCGIVRPSIVLPPASHTWTDERRRAVLCHELAHIRRRDLVSHLLGRLTCALYWFQPLAWSAARRMRAESERACDDLVLLTGTRPSAYADHLLEIASAGRAGAAPAVALPMAQPREFEARLLSILEPDKRREPLSRGQAAVLAALVLALAQPLVALTPARTPPVRSGTPSTLHSDTRGQDPVSPAANPDSVTTTSASHDDPPVAVETDETASTPRTPAGGVARPDPAPNASPPGNAATRPTVEPARSDEAPPSSRIAADVDALRAQADTGRRNRRRSFDREIERGAEAIAESVTDLTLSTLGQVFQSLAAPTGQADPQARAGLIEALNDPEPEVRRTAAWALSTHQDASVVDALVRTLLSDDNQSVREMSAWALAQLNAAGTNVAVEALAHTVVSDASTDVRATAAWALAQARTAAAAAALERAVQTDAAASVRAAAAWALGVSDATSSTAGLVAALAFDDATVRETAAWALGTLEPARAPDRLTAALRDAAPRVRTASAWALGRIADPETAAALQDAISDENAEVRAAVVWALGRLPDDAAIDALAAALRDGDADVRAAAAAALGGHGPNPWPWPWPWPRPRPQP